VCKVTGCLVKQSDTIERIDFDMRQFFLFLVFFLGLFWVIDAIAWSGANSAGAWQEAMHLGQKLGRPVLDQARQYLF
jgi:hypothetical protein